MQIEKLSKLKCRSAVRECYHNIIVDCELEAPSDVKETFDFLKSLNMTHNAMREVYPKTEFNKEAFDLFDNAVSLCVEVLTHIKGKESSPYKPYSYDDSIDKEAFDRLVAEHSILLNPQNKDVSYSLEEGYGIIRNAILDGIISEASAIEDKNRSLSNVYHNYVNTLKVGLKGLHALDEHKFYMDE